jgi:tRNA-(ms[2]io[6]A)-hydroxylase
MYSKDNTEARLQEFMLVEKRLIESPDTEFRFHSGVPADK